MPVRVAMATDLQGLGMSFLKQAEFEEQTQDMLRYVFLKFLSYFCVRK